MIKKDALFSSKSDEYETPSDIFARLNEEFRFDLDPCATHANAKCSRYFTKDDDGLKKAWGGRRVFCNPPYSRIKEWVRKCYYESFNANTVICMLIPARTDTSWFHDYIYHRAEIRFIRGRLRFGSEKYNAPFPSMIVIYRCTECK